MYTVLFAEDTDVVRELFCEALRRSGYCVLDAADGAKALSVARRHPGPIHLLITDIMMPQLTGPELRRALRASHPETSVLYISGYAGDEVDFDGPFLQKPFTPVKLISKLAEILQHGEAPRAFECPRIRHFRQPMATTYRTLLEAHRVSDLVLLISPDPEDAVLMREIVSTLGCQLESASDRYEAELALRRDVFGVVIAERDLQDGDWRDVLRCLERYSYNPLLIVVSRLADERLWAEVLNRCGFDVLAKPFAHEEATRVIGHALNTWNRRFDKEGRAIIRDSATRRRPVGSHHRGLAEYGT